MEIVLFFRFFSTWIFCKHGFLILLCVLLHIFSSFLKEIDQILSSEFSQGLVVNDSGRT